MQLGLLAALIGRDSAMNVHFGRALASLTASDSNEDQAYLALTLAEKWRTALVIAERVHNQSSR
jgi:hypothetical protein